METEALRKQNYNATIVGERIHHGTVMVVRVRPDAPIPQPEPGQWLELGLGVWEPVMKGAEPGSARRLGPEGMITRAYSLSCPILTPEHDRLLEPGEWSDFEFFLSLVIPPTERARRVPNLTGRLFCLSPGDRLFLSDQPMGEYVLTPVRPTDNVLFLSTGTGEAPHNLMIWDLLRRGHEGKVASIVSARHPDDLAYRGIHRRLADLSPRYRYHSYSTRDAASDGRHLQDLFEDGSMERLAGFPLDPSTAQIFVCGNPGMIGPPRMLRGERLYPDGLGMVELLETERGFNADPTKEPVNLHYERYW